MTRDGNEKASNDGILEVGVDLEHSVSTVRFEVISADDRATHAYTLEIRRVPASPIISGVTPGAGYLNVSWTAPDETGGADITSYDLRYIESNTADKSDANWTVIEDVWTSAVGGNLEYALTGLTGDTPYDIQVRAINGAVDACRFLVHNRSRNSFTAERLRRRRGCG